MATGRFTGLDLTVAPVRGTDLGGGVMRITVPLDNTTIEWSGTAVRIKDGGVTTAKLAASAVTEPKLLFVDVTTGNATTGQHGLLPKLSGNVGDVFRGDGTFGAPPAPPAPDPSTDTKVWMPLSTTVGGDDVLVYDASHQLIPTLTPI
jgi:hypothetical protein